MTSPAMQCLSFYTQMIDGESALQLYIVRYGPHIAATDQVRPLADQIYGATIPVGKWTKYMFTIDPAQWPNTKDFAIRFEGQVAEYETLVQVYNNSFIALDDIALSDGKCPTTGQVFYCDGSDVQYNMDQRCNFVPDCPKGDDEKNCGECDFEVGLYCPSLTLHCLIANPILRHLQLE